MTTETTSTHKPVNSPRGGYVDIRPNGFGLMAETVRGERVPVNLEVLIGEEAVAIQHTAGFESCDNWAGVSPTFGTVELCTDENGWVLMLGMFPDQFIRFTESHVCSKCPFPLVGAFYLEGHPITVQARKVPRQAPACSTGTCQR